MGLLLLVTSLLLVCLTLLLLQTCRPVFTTPNWLGIAAIWVYVVPAAFFLVWALFAPTDASRFRLALRGLGFRAETSSRSITVGGDIAGNEVWIANLDHDIQNKQQNPHQRATSDPRLTVGSLKFTPGTNDSVGKLELLGPSLHDNSQPLGLLMERTATGVYDSPLSIRLQNQDRLIFNNNTVQATINDGWWVCPPNGYLIDTNNTIERFVLGLRATTFCSAESIIKRTHPLNQLFKLEPIPLLGFIYRGPAAHDRSAILLAPLHPKIKLIRENKPVATAKAPLVLGNEAHLYVMALPHPQDDGFNWKGLRDLRSFKVRIGTHNVLLAFDTPEIYSLNWKNLKELAIQPEEQTSDAPIQISLAMGNWRITEQSLRLKNVSHKVGAEAFSIIELPKTWAKNAEQFGDWPSAKLLTVASPGGRARVTRGQPFWLGEQNLAAIQIDLLTPPVFLGILTLILALAKAVIATWVRLSAAQLMVAAMLELLVLLRVILGYRVWIMPPFSDEAMQLALVAWALLPWSLLFASLPNWRHGWHRSSKWAGILASMGLTFSALWCWQITGGGAKGWLWLGCHFVVGTAQLWYPCHYPQPQKHKAIQWWQNITIHLQRELPRIPSIWLYAAIPLLFLVVRVVLALAGMRESLNLFGSRFSLTVLHIPLAIMLESGYFVWLWRNFTANGAIRKSALLTTVPLMLGIWAIPGYWVSDFGLLLNILLLLLMWFWLVIAVWRRIPKQQRYKGKHLGWSWRTLRAAFAVKLAVLVALYSLIAFNFLPVYWNYNTNYLRILNAFSADYVNKIGGSASEDLMVMNAVLHSYTANNVLGKGYTASELSPHIKETATSDHVAAVFIAGEWGRVGITGLCLAYLLGIAAGLSMVPWHSLYANHFGNTRPWHQDWSGVLAGLAIFTFCIPSLYMIIANHGWLVFTGKNVYLFGLTSGSDILESFTLLLLFASNATVIRDC